jgi:hypothetical protein
MKAMKARSLKGGYDCKQEWPENCFCQCGDGGIVFSPKGNYTTAFFEAFPQAPTDTFIRGEGKTIEEAELDAFNQYKKFSSCDHSMGFERRDYTNGSGFCLGCGMFKSKAFLPTTLCIICKVPTNYSSDIKDNYYCEEHVNMMPEENKSRIHKMMDKFRNKKNETNF